MDQPFDKWTNLLTNGPTFWQMTRVFFSRFYVWIFHVKINLDCGCLLGVGYFFLRSRMFERCGVFFFLPWIADVWEVWDIFLRSRMFDRCGVFFLRSRMFDRCGVFFLRSRMFDRCRVVFEITNVWQVWVFFWDHECLLGVGFFFLRSWMFDRCGGIFFFFFWEMWRESLIFERDDSWMWFGASHQKGSKVRSRIFLVHRLDRARTTELELKIVCS